MRSDAISQISTPVRDHVYGGFLMGTGERSMKILLLGLALLPGSTWAQSSVGVVDTGDTAWLLTATALVSFMSLPGLALFYGGLVRAKNVLSVLVQCRSEEHTSELQSLMRISYAF